MTTSFDAGLRDALLAAAVAVLACTPAGHPRLSEVYYDAPGDDTGHEFVELYNPGPLARPLAGARLEAGDGGTPGRWTTRWTGGAADSVRAGGRFVIGGSLVIPVPDARATLDLQNGPDALRIVWPDGTAEVVGWGALASPEFFCGAPAADAPAGFSLARFPDDADTGANATDFRVATPSPGAENQPGRDLAVVPGSLGLSPARPSPGGGVRVFARVFARGRESLAAAEGVLRVTGDGLADSLVLALPALAAGESLTVTRDAFAGPAGRRVLRARVELAGDADGADDRDTLLARIGDGPLEVTEIQFHPEDGEGEWVEVRNRAGTAVDLASYSLSDAGSTRARLLAFAPLAPESLAVLAQNRAALLAAFPQLDTARVVLAAPWPSLNNSDGESGFADHVTLREADGLVVDDVAYRATGVLAGATLEKTGGGWTASAARGGSPLRPAREAFGPGVDFALAPRRLAPGADLVEVAWTLPWAHGEVSLELFDMAGRRIQRLFENTPSGSRGAARVRVANTGAGLFVAVLRARAANGTLTRTALLRIDGVRP